MFEFSNVAARRLCLSLCDDKVTAVRSAASRGLKPPSPASSGSVTADASGGGGHDAAGAARPSSYPTFEAFVLEALSDDPSSAVLRGRGGTPPSFRELPPAALARALDFVVECRRDRSRVPGATAGASIPVAASGKPSEGDGERESEALEAFLSLIEDTLMRAPSATDGHHGNTQMVLLHRSAAVALRGLVAGDAHDRVRGHSGSSSGGRMDGVNPKARLAPTAGVAQKLSSRGPWLQQWLGHEGSTDIREAFAEVTGRAALYMNPDTELVPLLRALGLKLKVRDCVRGENQQQILGVGILVQLTTREGRRGHSSGGVVGLSSSKKSC